MFVLRIKNNGEYTFHMIIKSLEKGKKPKRNKKSPVTVPLEEDSEGKHEFLKAHIKKHRTDLSLLEFYRVAIEMVHEDLFNLLGISYQAPQVSPSLGSSLIQGAGNPRG